MQTGFYFDQTRCTGCFACAVACKDWHDIPAGPARWMRIEYREEGKFPKIFVSHTAMSCYHCDNPVCTFVCPNEAITKREEDGVVVVDREKCREEHACGIFSEASMGPDFLYGETEAPCQLTCPAHLNIPAYIALIAKGKFKEALELIRQKMPLPSICGRVCLHPCEAECRRKDVDEPVAIMALKGFVTDNVEEELPESLPQFYEDKVAVIGSGPAGLAAAYDLIRMGYGVTVFESQKVAGGLLATGIPEHRLPRTVLKRDLDYLKALGIEIKTDSSIDLDKGLNDLSKQGYGALLLAMGAGKGQKLNIPGAELDDVLIGTDFMWKVNFGEKVNIGKSILVVGGGNVAMDCARAALRLGATKLRVACLECMDDIPAEETEVKMAKEEGIEILPSRTFTQIVSNNGKVTGVECLEIDNLVFDENGKPDFTVKEGTKHTIQADTVIFAIGQTPDLNGLAADSEIQASQKGTLAIDPETMMTGRKGIFSAGDVVNGPTSIIDAIASGQQAAFYINRYLQGDVLRIRPEKVVNAGDIKLDIPPDTEKVARQAMPALPVSERITNFREVTLGYSEEAAVEEAKRCLNCAGHLCKDVCPYNAPQFAVEEKAKMQKCDLCIDRWADDKKPICVEACPVRALDAGPLEELEAKYGINRDAHGFVYSGIVKPSIVNKRKSPL